MASAGNDAGTVRNSGELLDQLRTELDMPVYGTTLMTEDIDRSRWVGGWEVACGRIGIT